MLWTSRALWFLLPATVGAVLADAIDSWSSAPTITFSVLAYSAWLIGLVALLLPNERSFTALRIVGALPVVAVLAGPNASSLWLVALAGAHAAVATVFALSAPVANACAQAQAYGDELRRPLRTPPAYCLVLAIAAAVITAGVAGGPLLVAGGTTAIGIALSVVGCGVAALLVRSVHTLAKRFYVIVPAGRVVADSLVLVDPVLLPSERIESINGFDGKGGFAPGEVVDTRLGAFVGCIDIHLTDPGSFAMRTGRDSIAMIEASRVLLTPLRAKEFLVATAPPSANPHRHAH